MVSVIRLDPFLNRVLLMKLKTFCAMQVQLHIMCTAFDSFVNKLIYWTPLRRVWKNASVYKTSTSRSLLWLAVCFYEDFSKRTPAVFQTCLLSFGPKEEHSHETNGKNILFPIESFLVLCIKVETGATQKECIILCVWLGQVNVQHAQLISDPVVT